MFDEILGELRTIRKLLSKLVYNDAAVQRNPRRNEHMKRQLALVLDLWRNDPTYNAKKAAARAFRQIKGGYASITSLQMALFRELQKR